MIFDAEGRLLLIPGSLVDRFGHEGGKFLAPADSPYSQRSLPPDNLDTPTEAPSYPYNYHVYRVSLAIYFFTIFSLDVYLLGTNDQPISSCNRTGYQAFRCRSGTSYTMVRPAWPRHSIQNPEKNQRSAEGSVPREGGPQ